MKSQVLQLADLLRTHHLTIATGESCTGGGIGTAIASVDGASEYFVGGIIAYSAELKQRILGVSPTVIASHGIVSREVAVSMNEGVRRLTGADVAISITGYIGLSGGDGFAENGTVWICAAMSNDVLLTDRLFLTSDRKTNTQAAIDAAINLAIKLISTPITPITL